MNRTDASGHIVGEDFGQLYDSDIAAIGAVYDYMEERRKGATNYDGFDQEMKERFFKAGYNVTINWWMADVTQNGRTQRMPVPEVVFDSRVNPEAEFDHDKMAHEIQNDLLQTGEGGTIKFSPSDMAALDKIHRHR